VTPPNKPKLRMPPPPEQLALQQDAAARLLALDRWTEEPNNPPTEVPASLIATAEALSAAQESRAEKKATRPAASGKPWEGEGGDKPHPYHLVMSEELFRKLDYAWKRTDRKSMRELVLSTLEKEVDKILKGLN
jgi:hypothetical protein